MRIARQALFGITDANLGQKFNHADTRCRVVEVLMQLYDFAHLLFDGVQGIERRHRLLEDDRYFLPADAAHIVFSCLDDIHAIEHDLARWMRRGVWQKFQYRKRRHGLARTGFANQRHRLALGDLERHTLDDAGRLFAFSEFDGEIFDGDQGIDSHVGPLPPANCSIIRRAERLSVTLVPGAIDRP